MGGAIGVKQVSMRINAKALFLPWMQHIPDFQNVTVNPKNYPIPKLARQVITQTNSSYRAPQQRKFANQVAGS